MRKSIASYAIIKARIDATIKYLMQYNAKWKAYNFISGHYEPEKDGNSFKKTIIREVEEELTGLVYDFDFTLASLSKEPLRRTYFSKAYKELTKYEFYLFQLLFKKPLHQYSYLLGKNQSNKWFSKDEILSGTSQEGEHITHFPVKEINVFLSGGYDGLPLSTDYLSTMAKDQ